MEHFSYAFQAFWLNDTIAMPGGETQDFWDAVATTSIPHASVAIGIPPALDTASTSMSASEF